MASAAAAAEAKPNGKRAAKQRSPANIGEITVAWREHRPGHWAAPIS